MIISPFTPLYFGSHKADGIDSRYIQLFADTDEILIELIGAKASTLDAVCQVVKEPERTPLFDIAFGKWNINTTTTLWFASLNLCAGLYSVRIDDQYSAPFRVTDNATELENTTLIQYSMNSNKHRTDAVFFIDGMQRFFDFRVPGGFKDSGWTFGVESEQFVTDGADIVQLYGMESTQKRFTLGNSGGCPIWFGEMLNRILCCSYVYFDGVRYARKEAAVPEVTVLTEGVNSFVFSQNVQRVVQIDPVLTMNHQAIMRRLNAGSYRMATTEYNRLIK